MTKYKYGRTPLKIEALWEMILELFYITWGALAAFWLPFAPQFGPKCTRMIPRGAKWHPNGVKSVLNAAEREPKEPKIAK